MLKVLQERKETEWTKAPDYDSAENIEDSDDYVTDFEASEVESDDENCDDDSDDEYYDDDSD
jgi:hypothetical protein